MELSKLIRNSHQIAMRAGWWDGPERPFEDQVNNFHAEITEAWEEYRTHGMNPEKYIYVGEKGKPEGIAVELADLLIRLADTTGRYKAPVTEEFRFPDKNTKPTLQNIDQFGLPHLRVGKIDTFSMFVANLQKAVAEIEEPENGDELCPFTYVVSFIFALTCSYCVDKSIPLIPAILAKMEYNETRPYRHGNKHA
jgi:hypothetical protein